MELEVSKLNRLNLILASGSPRRRELMMNAGIEFQVIIPDDSVEEGVCSTLSPENLVLESSYRKAEAVAATVSDAVVIAADTVAVCQGNVMGKPIDHDHARKMLEAMNGKRHFVLTGVTVWHRPSDRSCTHVESTELKMARLDRQMLEDYLDTDDWVGKAGAFGYQDGLDWVQIVQGLESNVVGLPVELLGRLIQKVTC